MGTGGTPQSVSEKEACAEGRRPLPALDPREPAAAGAGASTSDFSVGKFF